LGPLTSATALTIAALALAASSAMAEDAPVAPPAVASPIVAVAPGGTAAPGTPTPAPATAQPVITSVTCRAGCTGLARGTAGSTVQLAGSGLAGATFVVFMGGRGPRDDVQAPVATSTPETVDVTVPAKARGGTLRVIGANGRWSKASTGRLAIGSATAAAGALVQAQADAKKVFLDGVSRPSVSYFVGGKGTLQVRVDLVREDAVAGPVPVASWAPAPVPSGTVATVAWDGAVGPVAPPEGKYEFRVTPTGPGAHARAATFTLVGHAFPVQGPHQIGTLPSQIFGAQRDGHTHQGQDVFAACGTPLVSATSGTVRYAAFQAAAGNFVVVRSDADGTDYVYMHLRDPTLAARGTHLTTGQPLGFVGDTGDADGCHLHFEKWPAPGWYTGGAPVDPLPDLQSWDVTV
jgi:murein DD-endopeptidase MepM/ murein hydrolase activator NlpD